MKILLLDIETAPHDVHVWGMWEQNVANVQIVEPGYTLCWAAKWHGKKRVRFSSVHDTTPKRMIREIHALVDDADVVIHYNGDKFDMPTLNKDFLMFGLPRPSPYKSIDLYRECKQFKFPSHKLSYVLTTLKIGEKLEHKGHRLWVECMNGRGVTEKEYHSAWRVMKRYNKQDVTELEKLYDFMLGWIRRHPNWNTYNNDGITVCVACGLSRIQENGWYYGPTFMYKRYRCGSCGAPLRGRRTHTTKETKDNMLVTAI